MPAEFAPTHLRTLGPLDLRGPERRPILSVLHQPKRLALLVYLTLAAPGGFIRRDTLLAMFWPELDAEHARNALSQALSYLRRSLGKDVIITRGPDEIGVNAERLRCDAAAFEAALEQGEQAQGLELYRGDLLEGFFLPDAPAFERWLDDERQRLRERAAAAAHALSVAAESAGNYGLAKHMARRAVALARVDAEGALRRLLALLGRTGDRAGALHEYAEASARMKAEYDVEPSAETQRLVERLRQDTPPEAASRQDSPRDRNAQVVAGALQDSPPDPMTVAPTPLARSGALHTTASLQKESRVPATRGKRRIRVALLVLFLVVAGISLTLWRVRDPSRAQPSASRVAVLPFTFHGGEAFAYLADGMVDLLSTNLGGENELSAVNPRALLAGLDGSRLRLGVAQASEVARQFGAGLFVLGALVEVEGRLRITAGLYPLGARVPLDEITVEGDGAELFTLVDELAGRLLASRRVGPGAHLARTAARTTHSLQALKAYLRGEQSARAGHYADAEIAFREAVAADSTFALAHYGLSVAAWWTGRPDVPLESARAALRHAARLSAPDRRLVRAWERYVAGDPEAAERLYTAVLEQQPEHIEALYQLAEVRFHWGPGLGRPVTEAKPAFQRVLEFEKDHLGALIHAARIAALEGDDRALDSLATLALGLEPGTAEALPLRALRAFARHDSAAIEELLPMLNQADAATLGDAADVVAAHTEDPEAAIPIARLLTLPPRDAGRRALAHILLAQLEAAQGRWAAASRELDATAATEPGWALQYRAAYAALPFLDLSAAELEAMRDRLARPGSQYGWLGPGANAPRDIYPPRRHYLLGRLSLLLNDPLTAVQQVVELEGGGRSPMEDQFARDLARVLRANLAFARGDAAEALDLLGPPGPPADSLQPHISSFPNADERWLRAESLRALGHHEEALRIYASFPAPSPYDLIYLAPSHLRRAETYELLGLEALAVRHYDRFISLWRVAEPGFQHLVADARRRRSLLRSHTSTPPSGGERASAAP